MAVEMYKDVDTGVVSAKDTIIDDLVDVFRNDDADMTFEEALSIVRELSRSQGFYCRLLQELEWIKENDREQVEQLEQDFELNNVKDNLDLILYFES